MSGTCDTWDALFVTGEIQGGTLLWH